MARKGLAGNVQRPKAKQAAEIAAELTGKSKPQDDDFADMMETQSFHLPVTMLEKISDLALLRLRRDKLERRRAKLAGEKPEGQSRRSGSAIVREALDAHAAAIDAETAELRDLLGD